jgi:hypothetical protein
MIRRAQLHPNRRLGYGEVPLTLEECGPIAQLGIVSLEGRSVYEAPTIIGTSINCVAPGSLSMTLAVVLIGALMVAYSERRKLLTAKSR